MLAVIYDDSTGRILYTVRASKDLLDQGGQTYLEIEDDPDQAPGYSATHMVLNGAVVEIPPGTVIPPRQTVVLSLKPTS